MMNPNGSGMDSLGGFTNESTTPVPDWAAIRDVYENDLSVTTREMLVRFGVSKYALQKQVEVGGWARRKEKKPRSVSRAGLIRRMIEALDRQMRRVEDDDLSPEKRVAMLGSMSRTLAKVLQMEQERRRGQARKSAKAAEVNSEMAELRKKIARRIEQLNQG